MYTIDQDDFLAHHGVLGMKWGVRKKRESSGGTRGKVATSVGKTAMKAQKRASSFKTSLHQYNTAGQRAYDRNKAQYEKNKAKYDRMESSIKNNKNIGGVRKAAASLGAKSMRAQNRTPSPTTLKNVDKALVASGAAILGGSAATLKIAASRGYRFIPNKNARRLLQVSMGAIEAGTIGYGVQKVFDGIAYLDERKRA